MTLKSAEIIGLFGLIISLASIWLHWGMQYRLANIEDRQKDGHITEQAAVAKMRFWKYFAPTLTLVGLTLMGAAAYGLLT
jgi:hypothetical protein